MSSTRTGRVFQETIQQKLHPEVVDGAAEKDRRGLVREHGHIVPFVPGVFEHLQFFDRLVKRHVVESATDQLVVEPAHLLRRSILSANGALEQVHQSRLTVEDALKLETVADRPVHRERANAEHTLHFIDRKSTRLNSSHLGISYAVFCL